MELRFYNFVERKKAADAALGWLVNIQNVLMIKIQ